MPIRVNLPQASGGIAAYELGPASSFSAPTQAIRSRVAYAAAHVVANPVAAINPTLDVAIDWEATLAYRRYLWSMGLAVAEAMDTAQRGMGLTWQHAQELIRRSISEANAHNGIVACGAGTDHLAPSPQVTIEQVEAAYEEQVGFVEGLGGRVILMASRALAARATSADDYVRVYGKILSQVKQPVILHWLGDMFDPALAGYWGSHDLDAAMDTCLHIIGDYASKIDGIKISLLDKEREISMRRRLPKTVKMYTGDDFNYPELIAGDDQGYSHALLGIFDAIAPAASAALQALEINDLERFQQIFAPTLPLSRHIFQAPTFYYKTGVVFMAYLNGHQSHFRMVGAQESARSIVHLSELFSLADQAGLLRDPELAAQRMRHVLALAGIE